MTEHPNFEPARVALQALNPRSVALGYRAVELVDDDQLADAQVGYSVAPDGTSLSGVSTGDWHADWLVVATEDEMGDPIFIDLSQQRFPVYTAPHGEGEWEPELIATSHSGLAQALNEIKQLSRGRENPVELENNPNFEREAERVVERIEQLTESDSEFWSSWLETA